MRKSADGLADFAEKIFAEKWPYRYGSYGNVIAGKRRSDCYGIRKAYSWDRGPFSAYIAAEDQNAETAYARATVKGDISNMPDRRGIIVCKKNILGRIYHAGIYVGNGMVIDIYLEGRPARKDPVTMHGWTLWFEDIFIDYTHALKIYAEPTQPLPYRKIIRGNDAGWFETELHRIGYGWQSMGCDGKPDEIIGAKVWDILDYEMDQSQKPRGDAGKDIREYLKGLPSR